MRLLLLMVLLFGLLASVCWGQTYSCRDSSGQLHFSDNPQSFPDECRGKEKLVKPGKVDNLNFVPATPTEPGVTRKFEESVESVERELSQKRETAQRLRTQAEALRARYRTALADKRRAKRDWSYDSRQKIQQADAELDKIKVEKQGLLDELTAAKMGATEKDVVQEILAEIEAK